MKKSPHIPDHPATLESLSDFPTASKRVAKLLAVSWSLDIEPRVVEDVDKKLFRVIASVRNCLKHLSESKHLVDIVNNVLREIGGRHFVNQIYHVSPILMKHFATMSLELQFLYLFAEKRGEIDTWAICHHWTVFWHNFWEECKRGTPYEKYPNLMCQVVDKTEKIRFDQHTFCLLDLDKRYILNADGKKWITMRPASIFSELDHQVYKTVKIKGVPTIEKVFTFRSVNSFAREIDESLTGDDVWEAFLRVVWRKLQE